MTIYSHSDFSELIGYTIVTVLLSQNKENILFITNDKQRKILWYATERDCCNDVYFNHISNPEFLFGAKVISAYCRKELSINKKDDFDNHYDSGFWEINTNEGTCLLEVRNDHNGYYGGSIIFKGIIESQEKFDSLMNKELNFKEILTDL